MKGLSLSLPSQADLVTPFPANPYTPTPHLLLCPPCSVGGGDTIPLKNSGDGMVMCSAGTVGVEMVLTDAVLEDSGTLHWPGGAS
ncbi:cullin 2 [Sarotherodon galilaeus]